VLHERERHRAGARSGTGEAIRQESHFDPPALVRNMLERIRHQVEQHATDLGLVDLRHDRVRHRQAQVYIPVYRGRHKMVGYGSHHAGQIRLALVKPHASGIEPGEI
jgi:hypothetical protein